jgi:DNA-binding GntR family transcriptional regulator
MIRRPKMGPAARDLSIREKAYLHIRHQIPNGNLAGGSGISELSLAKELVAAGRLFARL